MDFSRYMFHLILQSAKNIFYTLFAYYLADLTNALARQITEDFWKQIVRSLLLICTYICTSILCEIGMNSIVADETITIRMDVFQRIMKRRYYEWEEKDTTEEVSFFINDIDMLENSDIRIRMKLINTCISLIITGLAILYMGPVFLLIAVALISVSLIIPGLFTLKLQKRNHQYLDENKVFYGKTEEYFEAYPVIKSYGLLHTVSDRFLPTVKQRTMAAKKINNTLAISGQCIGLIGVLMILAIYAATGFLMKSDVLTIGAVVAIIQLTNNLIGPMMELLNDLNEPKAVKTIRNKVCLLQESMDEVPAGQWGKIKSIKVKDLNFAFPSGRPNLFNKLNLHFVLGKRYALIGLNGSGKSTLLKLISGRIRGTENSIFYSNTGQFMWTDEQIDDQVAYIPQKPVMFEVDESVLQNATLFGTLPEERFEYYCNKLEIPKSWFDDNKKCSSLSGGERQKIAVIQSLMSNKRILLWDEADSAMDEHSKSIIYECLRELKDKIVIVVTHDNDCLDYFDEVVAL